MAKLNADKDDTKALQLEQTELSNQLDDPRDHVDELARKVDVGVLDDDPLDGEPEICLGLVLSGKFQTALDLLKERFDDPKRSNQISPKLMARVRSLQGMYLKNLSTLDRNLRTNPNSTSKGHC
ncbi:MAG: hypothetical protein ABJN03_19480 [Ascidiaceihabitans sp.]|uniref:hypothetical protein n=1 Tax=Rhodobacterales TaxID=204455 RepID=UPI003297B7A0